MSHPEPETSRTKVFISNIIKSLFAGGLLFWLVKSGGIRPEYLMVAPEHIPGLSAACLIIAAGMSLAALRYVELLKGAGLTIKPGDSFSISAIMYFFTQCVMGSASGDVARYFYTTRITGEGARVGAAIIVDRIIGIMGLFMFGGLGMAFNWSLVEHSPELRIIACPMLGILCLIWLSVLLGFLALVRGRMFGFLAGITFPVLAGLLCISDSGFLGREVGPVLFYAASLSLVAPLIAPEFLETGFVYRRFFKGSKLGEKLGEVVSALLVYRNSTTTVLKIAGLTAVQHLALIYSLYLLSRIQNIPVLPDFNEIFFAAPLSFLAGVIPAPAAGLGVNEAAFETLLYLGSCGTVTAGASIFLMYRIWATLFSLSGLYFVMRSKK
ncbi:lysylphosphatidylglycerol synthase transmembrane domain-containing protein [Desulfovibrio sp. JC022]|uniref:lysylphosphatidylglycerol synthase transmembrane domain-containing protein n=1 Tax=Desulfovibrio sp. JC022 TaxID=2593642 RepID=UPI0013D48D9D|nr:lysylphosphatidylglycerol synthase transmembrane domain-containing protein [Desulfovibrio sp. JC022]NDV22117.1 flippase-like domain-containing protein [Desulfovibrio sp. JC022]